MWLCGTPSGQRLIQVSVSERGVSFDHPHPHLLQLRVKLKSLIKQKETVGLYIPIMSWDQELYSECIINKRLTNKQNCFEIVAFLIPLTATTVNCFQYRLWHSLFEYKSCYICFNCFWTSISLQGLEWVVRHKVMFFVCCFCFLFDTCFHLFLSFIPISFFCIISEQNHS